MNEGGRDMRVLSTPLWVVAVLAIACNLGAAPAGRAVCGLCEEPDRFVRLQPRQSDIPAQHAASFSHPLSLNQDDLLPLLRRIHVQSRQEGFFFGSTKGPVIEAFTAEDAQFLSTSLAKAFAAAQSEEVVVFGLAHPRGSGLSEITTGCWFIEGGALHLILANYRTAVTLPGIRSLLWEEPLRRQPGLVYELVPGEYQSLVQGKDEHNSLFGSSRASQIAIQYRPIAEMDSPPGTVSGIPTLLPEPRRALEERLEQLNRLRERGLITQEEYSAKKKELLDRL